MAPGKESRNPYRVFFETICIATIVAEEDATISFANHQMEELSGYSKEEIEGKKSWTEFVSEKDLDDALHYHKRRRENKTEVPGNLEFRFIDRDGNKKQVILMMDVIPGSNRSIASIVDITGRKQTEEALKESEGKYREILSTMEEGYYETDLAGNFVFFNDSLCAMLGYDRDELMRLSYKSFYRNPKEVFNTYNRVYRTGKPEKAAGWPVITKDGREIFAEVSISLYRDSEDAPMGFRGVARDITDRRRVEEALQESEERYREILATMEEGYYETDLTGNITYCNDSIARLLSYTREEFTGINYRQIYKDPRAAYRKFNQVFQSGRPEKALTMEMIRKDGATVYGEFSVTPVKDKEGQITGFRGIIRDITERHRFEEQLKYLSMHDQLTDLYNRAYYENELNRLSGSREYPITIVSVDLDGLKLVNDTLGHDQGDEFLVSCARVLQNSLRSSDIITRVGGDEFAAILPRTDRETGEKIVNRIYSGMESFNSEQQARLLLSASIGFATADDENKSLEETFKEADDLMYRDKLRKGINARSQVIRTLTATLGERDFMSEGHIRRLEELCLKTGKKINLSKKQLSNLTLLAQVHDIGKVGIPDRILFKEGSLTDEEWKTMRQHAEKGYRIALSSMDLSEVADLILKHHEKWTGNGYPMGIREEEIPVECRILAVADAYDAMTNDRPYRKAMSKEEAVAELKRCAGSHFAPEIVEVFLSVLEENNALENDKK